MIKRHHFVFRVLCLAIMVLSSTWAIADRQSKRRLTRDSAVVALQRWGELPFGRRSFSAYPVQLVVKGHSVRITSKYEQALPIYTHAGSLYLTMQLNPGVNWLNGLPRGRYRINNRTINIK